jgi:hypothetical protein
MIASRLSQVRSIAWAGSALALALGVGIANAGFPITSHAHSVDVVYARSGIVAVAPHSARTTSAVCPAGTRVAGGGAVSTGTSYLNQAYPDPVDNRFRATVRNNHAAAGTLRAQAACVNARTGTTQGHSHAIAMLYRTSAPKAIGGYTLGSASTRCASDQGLLGAGAIANRTRAAISQTRSRRPTNFDREVTSYYTPGTAGVTFKGRAACAAFTTGDAAGHHHRIGSWWQISSSKNLAPGASTRLTASCPSTKAYHVTGGGGYAYAGFPEVRSESMDPLADTYTVRFTNPSRALLPATVSAEVFCVTATTSPAG